MQSPSTLRKVAFLTAKLNYAKSEFSTGSTALGLFLVHCKAFLILFYHHAVNKEKATSQQRRKNQLSQKCCIKVSGLKNMKKGKAELPYKKVGVRREKGSRGRGK